MTQLVDRKAYFIGVWDRDVVSGDLISAINSSIQNEKGNKVKLQLYTDGLRVFKTGIMKTLQDFIPFEDMLYLTVSRRTPDLLFVIAKGRPGVSKYMIQAYRCANGLDSGMFLESFRNAKVTVRGGARVTTDVSSPGVGLNANIKTHDGINWTLRDKEQDQSKRELKQLVDIHGEKAVVEKNTDLHNGHGSHPSQGGARMYRKGKPQLQKATIEVEQVLPNGEISDVHSESDNVSESALRVELESLSQELRDIKLMLEKSTGIHPDQRQIKTETKTTTVSIPVPAHTAITEKVMQKDTFEALDAEVLDDDDEDRPAPRQNGTGNDAGVIRVNVPDYRTITERTSVEYTPEKKDSSSGYGSVTSRTSTMSYDNWKRQTTTVPYNDMPERLQWRSRTTVHARPRNALPSWSSDATDSSYVRVRPHSYRLVAVDPRLRHGDKKAHRQRAFTTTVPRPIEKVYRRPEVVHGSYVYRPQSGNGRPTILANGSLRGSQYIEPNNNFVKVDADEHQLLDVSGVDLDRETPRETIIRT